MARILAGRYELNEKVGEGGMAVVFKATDILLGRNVAVKILRPEYTKDMMFIESFRKESQLAASIVDPNIVNVYDVGKEGNVYYIVMELVEGEPLSEIIKREAPLEPKRAASITRQIAMALSTAHKHNLIHRDVKPHNVLISAGDVAKISDFGIAIKSNPEKADSAEKKDSVMGSIHYFSPEQARGAYVDERSDIYSLGIVLYEMLTGQVPFDGETAVEVALKHMNEPMVPPSHLNPSIPQDLEDIVMKATAKLQTSRYSSADEMITDLNFVKYSRPSDYSLSLTKKPSEERTDPDHTGETPEQRKARIRAERAAQKRRENLKKLGMVAIVLVISAAIIFAIDAYAQKRKRQRDESTFTVPYVVGMTVDEASKYLKGFDLDLSIEMQLPSDKPEGTIISQNPENKTVKAGQTIKVNVSRSKDEARVPSVIGRTQISAKVTIEGAGFVLGTVSGENSDSVAKDLIISQSPESGTILKKGEKVNIVISLGSKNKPSGTEKVRVPRVMQMTMEEAVAALEEAGLVIEEVKEEENRTVAADHIISQSITAGTEVNKGTKITLVVSKGVTAPADRTITLTLDYSEAKEDEFQVTVTLKDGDSDTENIFVEQRKKTDAPDSVDITGSDSDAKVVVFFTYKESGEIDTVREYLIDFPAGTIK